MGIVTEAQVEAGAKAMYIMHVKQARQRVDELAFDPSEVHEFVTRLLKESSTAQVLIFYSYLDDRIRSILALQMKHLDTKKSEDRVFGVKGPLETFSSRVLIAYHLGWLSDEQREKLDAFRKLRNAFAHRAFKLSLDDPEIRSYLASIDYSSTGWYERISADPEMTKFSPTLLSNLVTLTLRTFQELLLFPVAIAHHVHPQHIINPREEQPTLMKKVEYTLVKSLLISGLWS